ncbi:hypothetical protein PG994_009516 [Apiospora phragmitis]|uniref:Uncharacterized protein n=1 Tax=Apiospora phragmitis TaxID=2905665 RepID=A0ABR1U6E1_9PEZI
MDGPHRQEDLNIRLRLVEVAHVKVDYLEYKGKDSGGYHHDQIGARMPGLATLGLWLYAERMPYPALRREDRRNLADALTAYSEQAKGIAHAGRLISFRVHGALDGSLFWPQPQESNEGGGVKEPQWPNLQHFDVQLERNTPSGWWYFMSKGEPAYDDEPTGVFNEEKEELLDRNVPHEDTMQPLLAAWAKALMRMPSLRTARLLFQLHQVQIPTSNDEGTVGHGHEEIQRLEYFMEDWEVVYEAPGQSNTVWSNLLTWEERRCRRLVFHNTAGWRPVKGTMDLLQAIGSGSWPGPEMAVLTAERNKIVR